MAKKQNYDYINKFRKEKYDQIAILRKTGEREKIQKVAAERGFSTTTAFINYCIDKYLNEIGIDLDKLSGE